MKAIKHLLVAIFVLLVGWTCIAEVWIIGYYQFLRRFGIFLIGLGIVIGIRGIVLCFKTEE